MTLHIKTKTLWLFAGALLLAGVIAVTVHANPGTANDSGITQGVALSNSDSKQNADVTKSSGVFDSQTSSMGAVEVAAQPVQLEKNGGQVSFSVALNTHSVELDFDFTKIMYLTDDNNNRYDALEWAGNSGWHHVSGDIIFSELDPDAKAVTLHITQIENTTTSFEWQM